MKVWFTNLTSKQQKRAYALTIALSILLFYAMVLSPLFMPLWGTAFAAVLIERKIIKKEKSKTESDIVKAEPPAAVPGNAIEKGDDNEVFSPVFTITTRTDSKREKDKPIVELSHLDFGKQEGILGCYLNYEPRVLRQPTKNQLKQLNEFGVLIPDGITMEDASWMIKRMTWKGKEAEAPRPSWVALAIGLSIELSAFVGDSGLFREIVHTPNQRDRAALYAYAVRKDMRGEAFENMLEDPELSVFYSFADKVISDPALLRSLEGRTADDFRKPYRGTAIYKAAVDYLKEHKGETT